MPRQSANHGTLKNGVTYTASKVGEGFSFDGLNEYVDTALDVQPAAMPSTTWEAWVFPAQITSARQPILSSDHGGYDRLLISLKKWGNSLEWHGVAHHAPATPSPFRGPATTPTDLASGLPCLVMVNNRFVVTPSAINAMRLYRLVSP